MNLFDPKNLTGDAESFVIYARMVDGLYRTTPAYTAAVLPDVLAEVLARATREVQIRSMTTGHWYSVNEWNARFARKG
jgi:hypothetical protein